MESVPEAWLCWIVEINDNDHWILTKYSATNKSRNCYCNKGLSTEYKEITIDLNEKNENDYLSWKPQRITFENIK